MSKAFEQFESEKVAERKAARGTIEVETFSTTLNQIGVQENSPVCWSPNGEELCFVNGTHGITICTCSENNKYTRSKLLVGHRHAVKSILYHPTKPILVSCGIEGIYVWNLENCTCIHKICEETMKEAHEGQVECICWLYEGSVLLSGGKDSTIRVWNVEKDFAYLETIAAHKSSVGALAACAAKDYFVSAGRDSTINIWKSVTLNPDSISKRTTDKGIVCTLYASMDGHHGDVSSLTVSTDGDIIFSGARDNTIRAWDYSTHQCIREVKDRNAMRSHTGDVTSLFCINNNQFLLSFALDGEMHINHLGPMEPEAKMDGDLALTSLDDLLKGFTETETVQEVVNDELKCTKTLVNDDGIFCTAMHPTSPLMALSTSQNCIRIYDIKQNIMEPCLIQEFISHSHSISDISVNEQGFLVSVSDDFQVNVFNPASGERVVSFNTGASMYSVATDNDIIYTAGKDYVIHCYSINKPRFYQAMEQQFAFSQQLPPSNYYDLYHLVGHAGKIRSIAVNTALKKVYSGSEDGTVMIHSIPEFHPLDGSHNGRPEEDEAEQILDDHYGIIMDIAVSDEVDNHYYLASAGNDYALRVYQTGKHTSLAWAEDNAHNAVIEAVTFGHGSSSSLLFTGGRDQLIRVWNAATGEVVKELDYHDESITDLFVSKDGKYLISAAADKSIMVCDISADYKLIARYVAEDYCKSLAMTGNVIVAGYESGVIRIWPMPSPAN